MQNVKKAQESGIPVVEEIMPRKTDINFGARHEDYRTILKCFPATPNKLVTFGDVRIAVSGYEKREGGLFEQSFITYLIETPCLDAVVERRYSDFEWLRGTMEVLHPGIPIPPMPKKGKVRNFDEKHLRKRMMILEMCLNKMAAIGDVKGDTVFEEFLSLKGQEFEKFKLKNKKIESIALTRIVKGDGNLRLNLDPKLCVSLAKTQKYLSAAQPDVRK